jgi:hypothetical protein
VKLEALLLLLGSRMGTPDLLGVQKAQASRSQSVFGSGKAKTVVQFLLKFCVERATEVLAGAEFNHSDDGPRQNKPGSDESCVNRVSDALVLSETDKNQGRRARSPLVAICAPCLPARPRMS